MEEEIKEVTNELTEENSEQKGKTSFAYSSCSSAVTKTEIIINKDEEQESE